jgi:hypothetical protein
VERLSLRSTIVWSSTLMFARAAAASTCAFFTPRRRRVSSNLAIVWPRLTVSPTRTLTEVSSPETRGPAEDAAPEDAPLDSCFGFVFPAMTSEPRPGAVGRRLGEMPAFRSDLGVVIAGAATETTSSRTVPATVSVSGRAAAVAWPQAVTSAAQPSASPAAMTSRDRESRARVRTSSVSRLVITH